MKKFNKQILIGLLAALCTLSPLAGCKNSSAVSNPAAQTAASDSTGTSGSSKYKDTIQIDVFDTQANYQGVQSGWFGKIVKDKFNMRLNIIAPNVAGGGDNLFNTRSAAGNLGDIIMTGSENGRLLNTAKAGLLLDLTDKIKNYKNLSAYPKALEMVKSLVSDGKIYAIPSKVSKQSATTSSDCNDPTYGPYIRWDCYTAIGSPEINSMDDMLNVLKAMQQKFPKSDSGKKTYGFSFFKDWDGNIMNNAQMSNLYGYDLNGTRFLLVSSDGKSRQSVIDENSYYITSLKYMFKANQMGLVDPDSTTQNYDTMFAKYQDGQIFYSLWPWLGQGAYNTTEHKKAGKGFMFAPFKNLKIYSNGCSQSGNGYVIAVGSKAKDPDRILDFIDWLYSPEGVESSCTQTTGSCGPKGLTWEMKDGKAVLTDFGKKALSGAAIDVPSKWGTGTWKDGISALNYTAVLTTDTDPNTNLPYNYTMWDSYLADNNTMLDASWQKKMGAKTTMEYLKKNNMLSIAPGNSYIPKASGTEVDTICNQCKAVIVQDSWKMVFAKNQSEFNSLLKHMQTTVKGLGYDKVIASDQKIADNLQAAREAASK
jgi:multiple sugar transport system substrate-binding protein/putative aldouronate transport system substrate-binding protein